MNQEKGSFSLRKLWSMRGGMREVLPIALPLVISSGANAIMMFCDRVFLARFDDISIRAALPAGVLSFTLCCGFQAVIGYTGTFVAQYFGAKQPREIFRTVFQGLWLSLFAMPLIFLLIPVGLWFIRINGHAPEVVASEELYFVVLMLGGIFLCLNTLFCSYYSGIGRTRLTMVVNIIGAIFNIVADWILIFGCGFIPRMGILGAGLATVVGLIIPSGILCGYFIRDLRRQMGAKGLWQFDWNLSKRICRFGLPAAGHQLIDVASFTLFVMMLGRLGALEQAAANICFSINHLAFAPLYGVGVAASILVGQYQGAQDAKGAEQAGYSALCFGLGYMSLIGASFYFLPHLYLALFSPADAPYTAQELLVTSRPLLRLMAFWGFADLINIILVGALRGAGDTRLPLTVTTVGSWLVWLPVAALLIHFEKGILAQWQFLASYCCVLATVFYFRWRSGVWKSIKVIRTPNKALPAEPLSSI